MNTSELEISEKTGAIIMFGPPSDHSGMRPAEYFQVTLDPNMVSPSGEFIRFDQLIQGGELHGWQRIACLTVCDVLAPADYLTPAGCTPSPGAKIYIAKVDHG